MKSLKKINELNLLELPLSRHISNNYVLGIKEYDLEKYLIDNNYNIYSQKTLSRKEVIENDLTTDSTLLTDIMDELGFSIELLKDETNLFYINNEAESRYIEIIQEVCGVKPGLNYSISDSEDGELFSNIYVYDSEKDDKEYKMIYSFENDNYTIRNI